VDNARGMFLSIAGVPTGRAGMHENVPNDDVVIVRAEETA
jgi:hypothetical protein